ncbi:MAG: hypothetical protein HGA76_01795 [Candidatus Firestonebacteria bacterium]|nr:hypothetical protein [Candidatus Firestonebacteria bacterium]
MSNAAGRIGAVAAMLVQLSGIAVQAAVTEDELYLAAVEQFNQHDWEHAQQSLGDFQMRYPNSRWRWGVKLRLADLESDPERSEKQYREIIKQKEAPEWAWDASWGLAGALYARGRYMEGREIFGNLAQSRDVRRVRALYFSALCALAVNQTDAARDMLTEIVEHHPREDVAGAAMLALGDMELSALRSDAARRWYSQYLLTRPEGELAAQAQEKLRAAEAGGTTSTAVMTELSPTASLVKLSAPARAGKTVSGGPDKPALPPTTESQTYFVQAGAFSKMDYAQALVKKLRKLGLSAFILDTTPAGKAPLHLVRVGPFTARSEAQRQGTQLNQNEGITALVVSVPAPPHSAVPDPTSPQRKKP